jgi:hypothetical protein
VKNTIQQNHRPGNFCPGGKEKKVVAGNRATVEKKLGTTSVKISRFGGTYRWNVMHNAHLVNRDPLARYTHTVHGIENFQVPYPSVSDPPNGECPVMPFVDRSRLVRGNNAQVFDTDL